MKNQLRVLLLISIAVFVSSANAQSGLKQVNSNSLNKSKPNFYAVKKAFNEYWGKKSVNQKEKDDEKDGEWKQFKRWEWFMEQRVSPSGNFFDPEILVKEYSKYKATHSNEKALGDRSANWTFVGPHTTPGNGGGAGRIDCITFDPNNLSIIYIGAASGGLWKSIDGGTTWTSNTDLLPALSISDIAINPLNTNEMYIATGDKYGYIGSGPGFWGGTYSAGLMKSINGGATWNLTSLNFSQTQSEILQRVIVNPVTPNILIVASNTGIFRSNNSGTTWTNVLAGDFMDLKINPRNPNVLYASDIINVYRSNNAGLSWYTISGSLGTGGRNSIAVTPADTSIIYVWCAGGDFYKSTNGGGVFNLMNSPDVAAGPYGYYDRVLEVSPLDANVIFTGGFQMAESTDGGSTWNSLNVYVHPDNHCLKFLPGSGTVLFSCNDGGVFETIDGGTTWSDLSNGLEIKQYYRIGCSALDPNIIYAGAQDNGTDRLNGLAVDWVHGGDGMECLVDYSDNNIVYASYQNGNFAKSTDGGNTFNDITPVGAIGDWTTPMIMHPTNPQILFAGYTDVYETTDGGASWNAISTNIDAGTTLYALAIAKSDPNYIYASSYGNIFRTTNGGTSWNTITQNLPIGSCSITGIAVSPTNHETVWVTFSGYSGGDKVFKTTDGGTTWTNISGTLPNIPINCIVAQNSAQNEVYIGTDFGVYYIDGSLNDWVYFNAGLPNVIIDELEIQYSASKIRAATYGRGIWESDLNTTTLVNNDAGALTILNPIGNTCNSSILPSVRLKNYGLNTLTSVTINYQVDGGIVHTYSWTGSLVSFGTIDVTLPAITVSPGSHTITIYTSNPNGNSDNNSSNDSYTISFQVGGGILPLVEGFGSITFPPPGWTMQGSSSVLSRTTGTGIGGFGNSDDAALANYYSASAGTSAYLISPALSFSNVTGPLKLDFNVAYARYDLTYHDSLFIDISTDCGLTYTRVYIKGDSLLATAPPTTNSFVPTSSQWRAESVILNSYIGFSNINIRFELKSGYGNNLYLDDINIYDAATVGVSKLNDDKSVYVYPNPSNDQLNIGGIQFLSGDKLNAEIYNAIGEKVFDGTLTKNSIDIHNIKPGIYIIKMATSKGNFERKFIKH